MKFAVLIVCLISIKSALSTIDRAQRTGYFRRSQFPSNLRQRINPNMAKLVLLKHLLDLDCITSMYNRNPHTDRQKSSSKMGFVAMPAFNNKASLSNMRNQIGNDASQTMYFLNPKIIMVPSLKNTVDDITNDLKKEKTINQNMNLSQHPQTAMGDGNKVKGESFQKGSNKKDDDRPSVVSVTKNSRTGENKTASSVDAKIPRIPFHPTSSTPRPIITLHSFNGLKSNTSYEVEEIIDSAMDVDKKVASNFLEKNTQNKQWEKHEQEIADFDYDFKKILKEMAAPETTTPSFGNKVSINSGEKTPTVEITPPAKFQPHVNFLAPGGERRNNTERNSLKTTPSMKYPSRVNTPLRAPVKKHPNLKYSNKGHEIFDLKPSSSTEHFDFATPDDWKKEKIEATKEQAFSHPLFRLFNIGPSENLKQKPKNFNFFASPTTPNSARKLFDKDPQGLLADKRKLSTDNPLTSTVEALARDSTAAGQPNKTSLNLFIYPLVTPSNSTLESMSHNKGKSSTLAIPKGRADTPSSTFKSVENDSEMTYETPKEPSSALLSTSVKPELGRDQETNGKNSRKLHFNQDIKQEPILNDIVENSESKPRRSDILISDNMKDYVDDESRDSTLSYLKKLQPNNTIQTHDLLTDVNIDPYIRLIPDILNDIRENKISNEDLSLLSKVFGKYWPNIFALSNSTDLDVLPLLKMKNENDLVKFLESYFSKEIQTPPTEKSSGKELIYDYMDEYKDFYDEMLNEGMGEKRKRYRRKRDSEPDNQKAEVSGGYLKTLTEARKAKEPSMWLKMQHTTKY